MTKIEDTLEPEASRIFDEADKRGFRAAIQLTALEAHMIAVQTSTAVSLKRIADVLAVYLVPINYTLDERVKDEMAKTLENSLKVFGTNVPETEVYKEAPRKMTIRKPSPRKPRVKK